MTSSQPYLIRALYEWIIDNGFTPYIVANTQVTNIKVPLQYASEGEITLNIGQTAALHLQITNDYITFSARFSGTPMNVVVPIPAVLAIYAKETGEGMRFNVEEKENDNPSSPPPTPSPAPGKPRLKLVKS